MENESGEASSVLKSSPALASAHRLTENEFLCHCCYDILVNPTTLTCGHNFCRHCLALWWGSSHKRECPECREKWKGFPKINIQLRDAIEKLFNEIVQQRQAEIQKNPRIYRSLSAFQRYGENLGRIKTKRNKAPYMFLYGVFTALTFVTVVVVAYQYGADPVEPHDLLTSKPVSQWTSLEVDYWLKHLGPWTELYREPFHQENVNGRLLLMLGDEELLKSPYSIENPAHRRAVLAELERIKLLGIRPPKNLWEYKATYARKFFFLLFSLKRSPRLTIFYLYLFDYSETFLPFLHTCCPAQKDKLESRYLDTELQPSWQQWVEFLVKFSLLPYQLIAEFAWDWLSVHFWTSVFIIVNAMSLSVFDICYLWRFLTTARFRTLPQTMWNHWWKMFSQGLVFAFLWPFIPQFLCNCLCYWSLFFSPIVNMDLLIQLFMDPETLGF